MTLRAALLWVLSAFTVPAHAASFDCSKAQRPVEKAICGDPKLNRTDETMGQVYRDALSKLSSAAVGLLRADQVQWLAWVQQVCRTGDAQRAAPDLVKCMQPPYGERMRQLRSSAVRRNGITFLTRTQYLAMPGSDPADLNGPEYPGFGYLRASWPAADSTDAQWIAWNKAMERHAFAMAEGGEASKRLLTAAPVWTAELAEEQDTEVLGQVKSLEHNRVTASLNNESMGHGAAHPNEAFETFTWLLDSGRPLRADDVFAPGSAWKQLVAAACWKALSNGEQKSWTYSEVDGPGAKPLQDVISDTGNWTLEPDGLHISYPEYSVAPRVSPVEDTVIPWVQLKPVLAAGFVAP